MPVGYLIVNVYSDTIANPIKGAIVKIFKDNQRIITVTTNEDGKTNPITLNTVNESYTEEEQENVRPYETYDIEVEALGLITTKINGVQIFENITSTQDVYMNSIDQGNIETTSNIDPNTLWGKYPDQIIEEESSDQVQPYILKKVVIPEEIVVHDGVPSNTSAPNYTVNFISYIKNVASSEIYPTWPIETIKANVLAIISFVLNRIYTEWYKSRGYNFTVTSTTTYDQKYTKNGTTFNTISNIVDDIFNNYIRQGYRLEPLLAHYKSETTEKGYMSQWGSKNLGDKGYSALEILRYYYGKGIDIFIADLSDDYPTSFNGNLQEGSCNQNVYILQNQLNYIRGSYPGLPVIQKPSGLFDSQTTATVRKFQSVFNLPITGIVNLSTWYKINYIFTAVEHLAESVYS